MTQTIALWIAGAIIALLIADAVWLDWNIPVQTGQLLIEVIDWMAFWR